MSLETPSIAQLNDQITAQLQASLNQTIPLLPKAFLRVLAKTFAAVFILLYKYCGFMFLQWFVKYATVEETEINGVLVSPLKEWGRLIGVGDPTPATNAELEIEIIVENQIGTLPVNAQLISSKNGVTYITLSAVLLDAPTKTVEVRAVADQAGGGGAGVVGNLDPGDVLSFANPLANVSRNAEVNSQTVTGANEESVDVYRQRIIDRFQKRPQGGAYSDYELWGEEAAGIINVYPYTGAPGQVDVYSEATVASSGSPDGIPTAAQLQAVLDLINLDSAGLASRRNANAFVNSYPITRLGFDVVVVGITGVADLAQVQSDIESVLTDYFVTREPFIPGLSIPPRKDTISRVTISALVEDVVTAAEGFFTYATFDLTGQVGALPAYILGEGEKAKLVDVTFV